MEVGQTVYVEHLGKAIPYKVSKIGRKYFELRGLGKFRLETMDEVTKYNPVLHVYLSREEIEEEIETEKIAQKLRNLFGYYSDHGLTLNQLRRVQSIVDEEKTQT